MTKKSGAELIVALRSRPQTKQTPIIVMTGVGSAIDWQVLSNLGAHRFVLGSRQLDPLEAVLVPALAEELVSAGRAIEDRRIDGERLVHHAGAQPACADVDDENGGHWRPCWRIIDGW